MFTAFGACSHLSHPRIKPSNVYIDAVSMGLVKGSTIDFATELIGSSFRVVDNPQVSNSAVLYDPRRQHCGFTFDMDVAHFHFRRRETGAGVALVGNSTYNGHSISHPGQMSLRRAPVYMY